MQMEKVILKSLMKNEKFSRKVLPFLKEEYFVQEEDRILFKEIDQFINKYNAPPSAEALIIEVDSLAKIPEDQAKNLIQTVMEMDADNQETNLDWLINSTEKFCQDKAIYNAMTKSIEIMNDQNGKLNKGAIPSLLQDALAVSFDPNVGHDFLDQYEERYEYYHRVEEKLPFDLDFFNKITKNGVAKKTLNMIMGGVHTGKTLFLCHFSAAYLAMGKNVLYITLEMAPEEISRRIDCNLLNVTFEDLEALSKDMYEKKIKNLKSKTNGKLIIKEYPATSASVLHFRSLLNELNLKKNFVPDVIMIDYINLCASSRLKASSASDLYTWVKSISEEVRGMSQATGIPIWSATQLNRSGFASSDPDMTNTSESFGLPATVDFLMVLIATDELRALNQIMVKQLKNRYRDMELDKRFVIGVDKTKMRLYDVEQSAQEDIVNSGQTPTPTSSTSVPKIAGPSKDKFKNLKV